MSRSRGVRRAIPDKAFFQKLLGDTPQETWAKDLHVSRATIAKLFDGVELRYSNLAGVARRFNELASRRGLAQHTIRDMVAVDRSHLLPVDASFFASLRHSYYIDNDQLSGGDGRWYGERIELKERSQPIDMSNEPGRFVLKGRLLNEVHGEFSAIAERVHDQLFVLTGIAKKKARSGSFSATFTKVIDGVLYGTWTGADHFGNIAVYRNLLSKQEMSVAACNEVSSRAPIECLFVAREGGKIPIAETPILPDRGRGKESEAGADGAAYSV